jgi:hypothetical protein
MLLWCVCACVVRCAQQAEEAAARAAAASQSEVDNVGGAASSEAVEGETA